ncbi:hypothetical protein HOC32_02365, partial [Candidatus Woesearchaeota archaeon]|nr:hypothetical protein [Candidatus Woesearchaeota archaeon]
ASVVGEAYRRYSSYTKSRYKASAKKKVSRRLSSAASVFTPVIFDFSKSGSIALKNDLKLALDNDEKISLAIGENGKPTIKLPDGLSNSCAECTIGVCCGNDPQCLNGPVCKKCVSC